MADAPSRRPSILSTIMRIESGGRNVTQGEIGDINNRTGDLAKGFYQITGGTWRDFGGEKVGFKSAIDAPYGAQLQVAQNIPVARWGPNTQTALRQAATSPSPAKPWGRCSRATAKTRPPRSRKTWAAARWWPLRPRRLLRPRCRLAC